MSYTCIIIHNHVDNEIYRRALAEGPFSDTMRKCFICDIRYYIEYLYIDELVPEQYAYKENGNAILFILAKQITLKIFQLVMQA